MQGLKRLLGMLAAAVLFGSLFLVGCSDAPKPIPQKDIRSHADQFNENMKQEEAERGQGPQGSSHGMH